MQLHIRRSQRKGRVFGGKIYFALDVRAEYSAQEKADINKYDLGGEIIYNSQATKRHLEAVDQSGIAGAIGHLALAKMNLTVTIVSLSRGHHIECRDLAELTAAEEAVYEACKQLCSYLKIATSFNGSELVIDFNDEEPAVVAPRAPQLAPPAEIERGTLIEQTPAVLEEPSLPRSGLSVSREDSILR